MTDIFFILDESASMHRYSGSYISGINKIVDDQRIILKGTESSVSIIKFSDTVRPMFVKEKIDTFPYIVNGADYRPYGNTCLFDAIYTTFKYMYTMGKNTIVIILTDGIDNYSETTIGDVKSMMKSHESDKINILYVSPNDVSDSIGILLGIKNRVIFSESAKSIDLCMRIINLNIKKTYMNMDVELPTNVSDQFLDSIISELNTLKI